jgi:hypothetical protein
MSMRRVLLVFILALMLCLGPAASSQGAFYFGQREGIRVAFRVKGHRLVWANVVARLLCIRPNGEQHFNRIKRNYATPEYPLRLDQSGGFNWDTRGRRQEEGFSVEDLLVGRVGTHLVTGRYEFTRRFSHHHRRVVCRTGLDPAHPGRAEVPFRARRR